MLGSVQIPPQRPAILAQWQFSNLFFWAFCKVSGAFWIAREHAREYLEPQVFLVA
jgi:hypothetical protein